MILLPSPTPQDWIASILFFLPCPLSFGTPQLPFPFMLCSVNTWCVAAGLEPECKVLCLLFWMEDSAPLPSCSFNGLAFYILDLGCGPLCFYTFIKALGILLGTVEIMKRFYINVLTLSHYPKNLDYCSILWGSESVSGCSSKFHNSWLHWLPVYFQAEISVLMITFKSLNGLGSVIFLTNLPAPLDLLGRLFFFFQGWLRCSWLGCGFFYG